MYVEGHATCLWFPALSFWIFSDLPECSDSLVSGCEVLYGATMITSLWSYVVTWVMTWRFMYLFFLSDVENLEELRETC